jgi:hypothetical protein
MPSTLTPACREDHLQRNGRGEPDRDPGGTLDIPAPRGRPIPGNGPAPRPAPATDEVIAVTAPGRPRRPSPGWAMTALRRAIRILRYVNETLVLVLQALFPLPAHDDPARRQTRPQKGVSWPPARRGGGQRRCRAAGMPSAPPATSGY